MSELSTYLHEDDVEEIVGICADEIRTFLDYLVSPQKSSPYSRVQGHDLQLEEARREYRQSVDDFARHPARYSDDALVKNGANVEEAFHFPVRIEVRRTQDIPGASQIAAKGIYGDFRQVVLQKLLQFRSPHGYGFDVRSAGRSSFEVNVRNVNKALPLKYVKANLKDMLLRMRYEPGKYIDALSTRTVIAADGDSTTYGPPTEEHLPTIKESPAYGSFIEYLSLGGVYMLISGNDLRRTIARVTEFIPWELKSRVIIAANGGADLAIYDHQEHFQPLEEYRAFALKHVNEKNNEPVDMIFIGDNPSSDGNDFHAFEEMGEARSILVSLKEPTDKKMRRIIYIGGTEKGTDLILMKVNEFAKKNKKKSIFSNVKKVLSV